MLQRTDIAELRATVCRLAVARLSTAEPRIPYSSRSSLWVVKGVPLPLPAGAGRVLSPVPLVEQVQITKEVFRVVRIL